MLTYILQITIIILSATSAISLSDLIKIPASARAIISIISATIAFVLAIIKLCIGFIRLKEAKGSRRGVSKGQQESVWMKIKALLLTSVDWIFDLISAIAILNVSDYSDEDRIQIFVVIGTWLGVSEEIFEFFMDIIIEKFDAINIGICGVFELTVAIVEICFGIYLLSNISNDNVLLIVGIITESLILICLSLCCLRFICVCIRPPQDQASNVTRAMGMAGGL